MVNSVRTCGQKLFEYSLKPSRRNSASIDVLYVRFHQKLKEEISNRQTSLFYYYIDNNQQYQNYQTAYIARNDNDPNTIDNLPNYSNTNLITLKDYYRNSRDLSIFLFILTYFLNIVDASVDTHLLNYNLNNDLSINLKPNDYKANNEGINLSLIYNF